MKDAHVSFRQINMDERKQERDRLLGLADDALLHSCRVDTFRGTGRGGQKRNVTDSAVRVTHRGTGAQASSDLTRSQALNRREALRLLRLEIAYQWRCAWNGAEIIHRPSPQNSSYCLWLATTLDLLNESGFRISNAAALIGLSTGRLIRELASDPVLWQHVNAQRQKLGIHPLKMNS